MNHSTEYRGVAGHATVDRETALSMHFYTILLSL